MIKLGLISPKGTTWPNFKKFRDYWKENGHLFNMKDSVFSGPNIALPIIAALTPDHYDIEIIDENVEEIDFSKHFDIVGITGMTQQATRAYEIADKYREKGITVAMGGIHVSVCPDEAKEHCDAVVIGEGEHTWPKLLEDFENNSLEDFYKSEEPVNMSNLPIPRYDLIKYHLYHQVFVQTSRGCPHDCDFCCASKVYGFKYRQKPVEKVIAEIQTIYKYARPDTRIGFADDNLFVNTKYAHNLVDELKKLKIRWFAQTDIKIAEKEELLAKLKPSGCLLVIIGLESVSEESLQMIDKRNFKHRQLKNYDKYVQKIQHTGVGVLGAFITGLENDNKESYEKLKSFIIRNNLLYAQVSLATPLPGTRLRQRLEDEGRLLDTPWSNYTFLDVNFIHKNLSFDELQEGLVDVISSVNSHEVQMKKAMYFKGIYKQLALNKKLDIIAPSDPIVKNEKEKDSDKKIA